jgi:glycosyltransferase involved in cell wall biosynthesis
VKSSLHIGVRWSSNQAGGADRVFGDLSESLPSAGVAFTGAVAGPSDLGQRTNGLIYSFAEEEACTITRLRGARTNLGAMLAQQNPDILASHFALYTFPIIEKLRQRPFVMHFHGPWALESKAEGAGTVATSGMRWIERSVYQRADLAIVLSQAFAELLHREYGIPLERIRVVPGAVDLDRFTIETSKTAARQQLGWPNDRPILLSVRRLVRRMGLGQLVGALSIVKQHVPEVLCLLAGTGPMLAELKERVDQLQLNDTVRFLGFLPDEVLPFAYRAADISVVPTVALEGFGLVAAESLAAGTPAMVTPVGGLSSVVHDLSSNLIFESDRPEHIAARLTQALLGTISIPSDVDCRSYAAQRFSRSLMASRVANVYAEALRPLNS